MLTLPDPLPILPSSAPVIARVALPGSKSYTNRALPIAALARGRSTLVGVLDSDDTRYMTAALVALGFLVDADWDNQSIEISGSDGSIPNNRAELFVGNSGTSMRFLTALVALGNGQYRLDGTERMRQRPLAPLIDGFQSLGMDIHSTSGDGCPPVDVRANGLPGGRLRMRGDLSSQYFSAVSMVLPYAAAPLEIIVDGDLVSKPYIDMTADAMGAFGVDLRHDNYGRIWAEPDQRYVGAEYAIEPDASAASYFFALAAVTGGSVTIDRLPPDSAQGDVHFVDVLEQMGCRVERNPDDITVIGPAELRGLVVDMNAISDTVQTLAAIAPFAKDPVTITNVAHIRHKETDRISAMTQELRRCGVHVDERVDGMTIYPSVPHAATIQTYDDHRMAMSFAVTGVRSGGISIADPGCVAKTVPDFWDLLFPLTGQPSITQLS